ncbi:MAG: hypothetical protein A2309_03600 [Bacteroidetes bacterium RIFOXYB2_FULL_35_7]|nr:MAG: hypothetical protein A2309_03600 [Bacteroidetes bacterium RIFOXYB2_FULL_35_7]
MWVYEKILTPLPPAVVLRDANEIIPADKIFRYKYKNQFGHGKGSLGGFSDIFRYKLLYEHGGWWADMDVTCIKPFDFAAAYVFRTHQSLKVVGNIMKCPPKSELMKLCYEKAIQTIDEENKDWHKPIQILNDYISELNLEKYIIEMSNPDSWRMIRKLLNTDFFPPEKWNAIHWVNEEWRRNGLDKNYYLNNSYLGKLMQKYRIEKNNKNALQVFSEKIKLSYPYAACKYVACNVSTYITH